MDSAGDSEGGDESFRRDVLSRTLLFSGACGDIGAGAIGGN